MKKILFGLLTVIAISSCSNEKLTNEKALEILKNEYKKDCSQQLLKEIYSGHNEYNEIMRNFRNAETNGLLNVKVYNFNGFNRVNVEPTQKAKNEFRISGRNFKVANVEIINIIGISNNENNSATVRFSYKYKPNPLFNIRRAIRWKNTRDCPKGTLEEEITFTKFDTGWKIQ